jgi:hypothetical protein
MKKKKKEKKKKEKNKEKGVGKTNPCQLSLCGYRSE